MEANAQPQIALNDVSQTSLLTLYCHALESQSKDPILDDPKAVELTRRLSPQLATSKNPLNRQIAAGKIDHRVIVHIALRAKRYDAYTRAFLAQHPTGTVVNLGCGMDTRFWRADNGQGHFYDLDLPEVIALKQQLLPESERYHFIASSALEEAWMDDLSQRETGPFLFLAEGVFMYLHEPDVRALVLALQSHFPGCELVCEVFNKIWLAPFWRDMISAKMQRRLPMGKGTRFHSGVGQNTELETWGPGIEYLDDWSYFDEDEKKLGAFRLFKHVRLFRETQWTLHYRLNKA
ncbi:MAG: class I SAM-dependent methyltransferase [Anaerolineae bacterium]|jgi:methyltransferase (TIGR00027 family)|nr:class I SAM-dependent methyltransferase [Anaerolineae bacterium]